MDKRRMCPNCRAFITTDDKICPYCDAKVGPRAVEQRAPTAAMGGLIPHAHFTTVMILLINTGLYVAMVAYASKTGNSPSVLDLDSRTLVYFGGKYNPEIIRGEWWRLITAGFLHGGLIHFLMNSWVLFSLGADNEDAYGTSRMIVIYFISTITGFLASFYWSPALSIGSSAGIFGLLGAMIALGVRDRSSFGEAIRAYYTRWAIYALAIGLFPMFGVDNAAHVGGIAGGFAIGYIAGTPGFTPVLERMWKFAAGFAIVITLVSFARMLLFFYQVQR